MDRVALIGHSRGGEAVAVAAALNELSRYPDDATLALDYGFNIRGVIAIAPADGQYEPRDRGTPLRDVNYFVIHGSLDGDVSSFMGSSQYSRIDITHDDTGEGFHFKSTLHVSGANHGQFNTGWGRNDMGGLWGLALDTGPIMDPEEQRRIARVYFSAFLEVVLRDDLRYLPIFADVRRAARWVPDTFYLQAYSDSRHVVLAHFDEDLDPATTSLAGGWIEGQHLTKWREQWIKLKWKPLDTHVAVIAWDEEAEQETASFAVSLPEGAVETGPGGQVVFSLSAADEDTLPEDWEEEDEAAASDDEPEPLDWSVVLTDASGQSARLALSHERLLYPQIKKVTRRASFLEFGATSEVILQRFAFELDDFVGENPAFDARAVREIRFVFDRSPAGAVIIDDIGFVGPPRGAGVPTKEAGTP